MVSGWCHRAVVLDHLSRSRTAEPTRTTGSAEHPQDFVRRLLSVGAARLKDEMQMGGAWDRAQHSSNSFKHISIEKVACHFWLLFHAPPL